jgi:small ligand-binding sensory domain FIST
VISFLEQEAGPAMNVMTLQGIVENGQIRLADDVRLPENATVYVVVPGVEISSVVRVGSPRLAHPEQAVDFKKEVIEEIQDAGV